MNKFLMVIVLAAVLSVLKAAALVLALVVMLSLVVAFIRQPRDTLLFLGSTALVGLAAAQPLACILTLGVVALALVVAEARRPQPRLPDGSEHHLN